MSSLRFSQVAFSYTAASTVLAGVNLHLDPGWTGVVGANGSGKSTLLALIAGNLVPTAGQLIIEPASCRPVLCPQEVEQPDETIAALASRNDGDAQRWIGRLGLDPEGYDRWPTLSPGERKRWQVAAALALDPGVLLLDEPTNHLDLPSIEHLQAAIVAYPGAVVLVSHDDELAHATTKTTWQLTTTGLQIHG